MQIKFVVSIQSPELRIKKISRVEWDDLPTISLLSIPGLITILVFIEAVLPFAPTDY